MRLYNPGKVWREVTQDTNQQYLTTQLDADG